MKSVKLVFIILTACAVKTICGFNIYSMDAVGDRIILSDLRSSISSTGILKAQSSGTYKADRNKTVILSAPSGYSIFAAVRLLDLRPNNQDYLTLFANNTSGPRVFSNDHLIQWTEFDRLENKKTYYAPDGQLGVNFLTGSNMVTWGYQGFEILYTVQGSGSLCPYGSFRCDNGRCINSLLKCDSHNHCGDRSDQRHCYYPDFPIETRGPRVAGIVAGVVFLLIAVACIIYIMIRRARLRKTVTRTYANQHPPPTNIQGYPPPYPEPGTIYPPPPPPYTPYQGVTNPGYH